MWPNLLCGPNERRDAFACHSKVHQHRVIQVLWQRRRDVRGDLPLQRCSAHSSSFLWKRFHVCVVKERHVSSKRGVGGTGNSISHHVSWLFICFVSSSAARAFMHQQPRISANPFPSVQVPPYVSSLIGVSSLAINCLMVLYNINFLTRYHQCKSPYVFCCIFYERC